LFDINPQTGKPKVSLRFKDWQLREGMRLYQCGRQLLSDAELLAHLIRNRELAETLLNYYGSLQAIADASIEELKLIYGVGDVMAEIVSVAFELGRRSLRKNSEPVNISEPLTVYQLLKDEMIGLKQEHLKVLPLTTKNDVIKVETVFIGTLNNSIVHPREIFKTAIRASAAGIIIAHNHPSGDATPSSDDISVTKQIGQVAEVVQIPLLDHVIIGDNNYVSLKEHEVI